MGEIQLTGLKTNTKYVVSVKSVRGTSESVSSEVLNFSTPTSIVDTINKNTTIKLEGGSIYAGAKTGPGVLFNQNGLIGLLSPTACSFYLDSTTGNAYFAGSVIAAAGQIGGFRIGPTSLSAQNIVIDSSAGLNFGPNKFIVDNSGNASATSITLTGGTIGGLNITTGNGIGVGSAGFYATTPYSPTEVAIYAGSAAANRTTAPFRVDYSGNLVAQNASITGNINATSGSFSGKITATTGQIGGWTIGTNDLSSDNIFINSLYGYIAAGAGANSVVMTKTTGFFAGGGRDVGGNPTSTTPFWVTIDGNLRATNASITGNIVANSGSFNGGLYASAGNIGGWTVASTQLTSGNVYINSQFGYIEAGTSPNSVVMNKTTGFYAGGGRDGFGNPTSTTPFWVTIDGNLRATNASIAGNIVATSGSFSGALNASTGNIGGWSLAASSLYATNILLDTASGIILGSGSQVKLTPGGNASLTNLYASGTIIATSGSFNGGLYASAGNIGNWNITTSGLSTGSVGFFASSVYNSNEVAIFAGSAINNRSTAPFRVTYSGDLVAQNASITGNIVANSGSFTGAINAASVYGGYLNINGNASISGYIVANSGSFTAGLYASVGTIGGFNISSSSLSAGTGATTVGLVPGTYPFFAGNATPSNAPFKVDNSGNLVATNASITGNIVANSGSFLGAITASVGRIGGFTLQSNSLSAQNVVLSSSIGLNLGNGIFSVDQNGNLIAQSASISGSISAQSGQIGGFSIKSNSLSAQNIVLASDTGFNLGGGQFTVSTAGAMVAQQADITGKITASMGTIGGWNIDKTTLYSGTGASTVAMSTNGTPKIYAGLGNHGDINTGFYLDGASRFSLGNQLIFNPARGTTSASTFNVSFILNSTSVSLDNSSSFIKPNMIVTSSLLPVSTYVASAAVGNPAKIIFSSSAIATGTASATFIMDDFADLTIAGIIRGKVENVQSIAGPRLFSIFRSAIIDTSASTVSFTTDGHAFIKDERIIFDGIDSAAGNGLSALNYAASAGNAFLIQTASNSINFSISYGGYGTAGLISGNVTASGNSSIQELTLGLHPSENTSNASHSAGIGIRLDKYNWWLTNNQFRVGSQVSYFSWNGSKFIIQGGGSKQLQFQVGDQNSNNLISIVNSGSTPTYNNANTPFYVDGTGSFSLGTGLTWDGSTLTASGNIIATSGSFNGGIYASVGKIAGFTLSASTLSATNIGIDSTAGIALGSASQFRVTTSGNASLTNIFASGTIIATTGSFTNVIMRSASIASDVIIGVTSAGALDTAVQPGNGIVTNASDQITTISTSAGLTITTSSTPNSGARVNLTSGGLFAYNSGGTQTVAIDSSTGNASFTGNIVANSGSFAGALNASVGQIGGWSLSASSLYATNILLDTASGIVLGSGSQVKLTLGGTASLTNLYASGTIIATSGSFNGSLYASVGKIANWDLSASGLYNGSVGFFASSTYNPNEIAIFAGSAINNRATAPFKVTYSGDLVAQNASITGNIIAQSGSFTGALNASVGQIGGWSLAASSLYATNILLDTASGIVLGSSSQVKLTPGGTASLLNLYASGTIVATSGSFTGALTASVGRIGGWSLAASSLFATNILLDTSSGIVLGSSSQVKLTPGGAASLTNLFASGTIIATSGSFTGGIYGASISGGFFKTSGTSSYIQIDGTNNAISFYLNGNPTAHISPITSSGIRMSYGGSPDPAQSAYPAIQFTGKTVGLYQSVANNITLDDGGIDLVTGGAGRMVLRSSSDPIYINGTISSDTGNIYIGANLVDTQDLFINLGTTTLNNVTSNGNILHLQSNGISRGVITSNGSNYMKIYSASLHELQLDTRISRDYIRIGETSSAVFIKPAYNRTTTNTVNLWVGSDGLLSRNGTSSRKIKNNINYLTDLDLLPDNLLNVPIRQFKYKENYLSNGDKRYDKLLPGFIVEELIQFYPIAVDLDDENNPSDWNFRFLIPPMLKLIQNQNNKINDLEARIAALENK